MLGETLSHYRILSRLGSGGMGEVYLAEDPRLGRKVALKVLPAGFAADEEAKRRFLHEARAASNLNHPNIVTIYDIGAAAGRDFIAMEYIEGESLRASLAAGRPELKRALEWIAQAASALAAAHDAALVHRDIKPENLMVNRAGQIKVLDFGLAKLIGKHPPGDDAATLTDGRTRPGALVGTAAYMSPEQAEGRPLDSRTDIFSLGLVLYEAVTGRRAFQGKTALDTLHAIVHNQPRPAAELNPGLPAEASDILDKALAKDPLERYRHAGDFELDLRRLKRVIEAGPKAEPAPAPRPASRRWLAPVAMVLVVAAAFAGWWLARLRTPPPPANPLAGTTLSPLTTDPGLETDPTFSPDGETIAYSSDRTGNFEIFLKQISGGPDINLTNNPADDIQPAFSPDGRQIAFVSSRSGSPDILYYGPFTPQMGGGIWVMSALGGPARRIVEAGNFPSWSPDGSHILYESGSWFRSNIYKVPASGGAPQQIPVQLPQRRQWLLWPSYSPNGRWIVFEQTGFDIHVAPAEGGQSRVLMKGRRPVWSAEGSAILYSASEPGRNYSLWRAPFSSATGNLSGPPAPLTIGRGRDALGAVSRDGKRAAFAAMEETFNIEIMPFDAEAGKPLGSPQPITSGNQVVSFMDFSPDGRSVVFDSRRGVDESIWRWDPGAAPIALTSDRSFRDGGPQWSPDGRLIAFRRTAAGQAPGGAGIWVMSADGANPRRLLEQSRNAFSRWLPNGRGIVLLSDDQQLTLLDLETNTSRAVTNEPHVMPVLTITPDGKLVIYQSTQSGNVDLRAVPIEGGPSRVVVATPHQDYHPFVSPSGRWLYFHLDHKNLWRVPGPAQDFRPAAPQKITDFPESGLFLEDLQIPDNGRRLMFARGRIAGDIWLLTLAP